MPRPQSRRRNWKKKKELYVCTYLFITSTFYILLLTSPSFLCMYKMSSWQQQQPNIKSFRTYFVIRLYICMYVYIHNSQKKFTPGTIYPRSELEKLTPASHHQPRYLRTLLLLAILDCAGGGSINAPQSFRLIWVGAPVKSSQLSSFPAAFPLVLMPCAWQTSR